VRGHGFLEGVGGVLGVVQQPERDGPETVGVGPEQLGESRRIARDVPTEQVLVRIVA
jgi:hypothetical protein